MAKDDWRTNEYLKKMRQSVTCPYCGSLVSTEEGFQIHKQWHDNMNTWVQQIADNFELIFSYVTNDTDGLEKRFSKLLQDATKAITDLRTDATNAIGDVNSEVGILRQEANNAINSLRADATNAIQALGNRITALEIKLPI